MPSSAQFLGFIIPLLILGLVTPAIIEIGNRAGKMLLVTVALAYVASVCAGFFSYFTSVTFFPSLMRVDSYIAASEAAVTPRSVFHHRDGATHDCHLIAHSGLYRRPLRGAVQSERESAIRPLAADFRRLL